MGSVPLPTCPWISLSSQTQDPSVHLISSSWDPLLTILCPGRLGFWEMEYLLPYQLKKKKKGHHSHQRLQSPQMVSWWALSKLMKERVSPSSSDQTTLTPHSEPWGNSGCENRIRAPDSWDTFQRNDFSEPRLLHLPTYWKVLNSLTGDTDFL